MERIKNNKTLKVMLLGILIWGIILQLVILFFKNILVDSIGLWCGIAVALFMGYNMAEALEDAMDYGEAGAVSHMRKFLLIRYGVACASIFILGVTGIGNVITCFLGILGLKLSAYLEPWLFKLIYKKEDGSEFEYSEEYLEAIDSEGVNAEEVNTEGTNSSETNSGDTDQINTGN